MRFEVKRTEKLQLYAAMQQAIDDAQDHLPVVLHRANTRPWVAIVRLEDLPELVVKLYLVLAAQA